MDVDVTINSTLSAAVIATTARRLHVASVVEEKAVGCQMVVVY